MKTNVLLGAIVLTAAGLLGGCCSATPKSLINNMASNFATASS